MIEDSKKDRHVDIVRVSGFILPPTPTYDPANQTAITAIYQINSARIFRKIDRTCWDSLPSLSASFEIDHEMQLLRVVPATRGTRVSFRSVSAPVSIADRRQPDADFITINFLWNFATQPIVSATVVIKTST